MAGQRPNFIDLRSQSHGPFGGGSGGQRSPYGLPSPRLHIAGEIPPELSPLDAFAAQSRLLQKQLEEEKKSGRRVSRLPPLMIANSLAENRPGYLRSASASVAPNSPEILDAPSPGAAIKTEVEVHKNRPISLYPSFGDEPDIPSIPPPPRIDTINEEPYRGRGPGSSADVSYFGARTEQSPTDFEREHRFSRTGNSPSYVQPRPSADSLRQSGPRRQQDGNLAPHGYSSRALAPPRSPFAQREPSPRSTSDSSEDDYVVSHDNLGLSPPHRKESIGSAMSTSPTTAAFHAHTIRRTPSISSEISVGGTRLPRPAFNFSRPLSRASMISLSGLPNDGPSRQASSDSQPSFVLADDTANTPVSIQSEGFPDTSYETGPAPSYVYSKFSLPRGKLLQRNSLIFQEPPAFSGTNQTHGAAPPSPPSQPTLYLGRPSLDPGRPSYDGRPSTESIPKTSRFSEDSMSVSGTSSSTIKARSLAPSMDMDAEQHVEKAIEFHEAGSLTKSTYHLRLAARQNHPTGMLLYALACRHGWGMRANQKEGVAWLRKAADCAGLEVADDEQLEKGGVAVDFLEKKSRKAQFALSIYELGVSHMNGWGIEQDKALALRCFEIAGSKLSWLRSSQSYTNWT